MLEQQFAALVHLLPVAQKRQWRGLPGRHQPDRRLVARPTTASVGNTVSVFGRNLSNQNGTTNSWIYIQPPGYAGQWVTPTSVNPYQVSFTVPSLSNGNYQVWVHNGHGGHYGWSGPLTLTVVSPVMWTSTQFNVQNYGATGNGTLRRHRGHEAAMTAAAGSPYSTIYFPAGTYMISDGFIPPTNVRWLGAGVSSTFVMCNANFTANSSDPRSFAMLSDEGLQQTNVCLQNMTSDANNNLNVTHNMPNPIFMRGQTNFNIIGCAVKFMNANYAGLDLEL